MGGNSRQFDRTNRMLDTEYDRVGRDYGSYIDRREGFANDVRDRSNNDYNMIQNRIMGLLDDPEAFGSSYFRDFANTGGLDEENKRRIRGLGVFDEFAKTGGIDEGTKSLVRANAAAGGRGIYDATARQLDTGYNAQGGFNPGYNAQSSKLIRDSARAVNESLLAAELGLEDRILEGKKWGAGSASGAELGLVDALQRGKMFGAEGMRNEGTMRASLIDSLRGLRSDTPGELAMYEGLISGGMGDRGAQTQGLLSQRYQANPKPPGFWDRFTQIAGAAAPMAAGFMTGGSGANSAGANRNLPMAFSGGSYGAPAQYNLGYGRGYAGNLPRLPGR